MDPAWPWWNVKTRKFTIFDNGDTPFETSSLDLAARAVVCTILPEHIEHTKNRFVHVRSATYTPNKLLGYLKKYTGTTDADWDIKYEVIADVAARGQKAYREETTGGNAPEVFSKSKKFLGGIVDMVSAALMGNGGVNQFHEKPGPWMKRFGLSEEDPEEVVRDVVAGIVMD